MVQAAHLRWISGLRLPNPAQQIAFEEYVQAVGEAQGRLERLEQAIVTQLAHWRWRPVVQALQALRVVSEIHSVRIVAELGDFRRFESPRKLMAYLGLIPSEDSSGPRRRQGSITKAGNSSARRAMVEAAQAYAHPARVSWVIARRLPRISRPLTIFAYIPMLFTGGLVPLYLLVTQVLDLSNSWFSVILPIMLAPFLIFVAVSFFRQLPEEIFDCVRMDGAGELRIFFQIVLPLSKPILAVLGLFYAVTYWNEWFMALLFISDPDRFPLQLILQNLISNVTNAATLPGASASEAAAPVYQLRFAMTVMTIAPILFAYPFAQRFFVKGLTLGASKG